MVMHFKGHNGFHPCWACNITRVSDPGNPHAHTLYVPLDCSHHPAVTADPGMVRKYNPANLPLRTDEEVLQQAREVQFQPNPTASNNIGKKYSIKGTLILSSLSSVSFTRSFPHDFMHLMFENLLTLLTLLWTGQFKGLNEGTESYQLHVLLSCKFDNIVYFNHFITLVRLVNICLQFELSHDNVAIIRCGFIDWYDVLVDKNTRRPRLAPSYYMKTFYGQLQNIIVVCIPATTDLGLDKPQVLLLTVIQQCIVDGTNTLGWSFYIKMRLTECLVGRVPVSGGQMALIDCSNNIQCSYYEPDV
ncbi:hypothetical protein ARMSODRAFT_987952 [Armillaria solidipes]|uniref:Uncharacterized protein n=1 Tax=Armillaria solidipes TaxID=1076256 RepID=A0A2H3BMZ7_9AGAR|nr:hypothetical protein ARMSODRAFT_987952 [Armillaria solidipes]